MKKSLLAQPCKSFALPGLLAFILSLPSAFSQIVPQQYFTAELTYAVKLGTTKPLYESVSIPATDAGKLKSLKANKPNVVPNFGGRRKLEHHNPDALPKGIDPLFGRNNERMPLNDIKPLVNVEGITEANSGSTPPDVNGDIGRDFYVEIVNATFFRVYDKAGAPVSNLISANSIWSQVSQTSRGDPILLYDQAADRWLLTEFPSSNRVLVAISHTSDPRGSWDAYAFQTPRFPDFPKYGIWPDAYYLTTNESGGSFPIYAINREDILAGAPMARIHRLTTPKIGGVSFEVGQPVDWDGLEPPPPGSPGIVVKLNDDDWGVAPFDQIILYKVHINWDTTSASHIEIVPMPATPYDTDGCLVENTGGFSCVPQPNGQGIDGAEWIITNKAQYRNFGTHESFVMCFMVDVTGEDVAGIRWMEFRKTGVEDWYIYQEGTVGSDDGIHRFMPSIGIDGQGNIGLGYSVSGFNKFPSLRYTGRYESDPLGMMTFIEYEFATGKGSQGTDRFGDYASMSVDPTDDATFWFAGEYLSAENEWSTKIVAFRAHRDTFDVFPITLISPENDDSLGMHQVRFTSLNRGLNTVKDFQLGYQFNHEPWVMEPAGIDSLPINQELDYTFLTPVSINSPGNYPLRIATFLDNDLNKKNDTLSFMITKYAQRDIALQYVVPGGQGQLCASSAENMVRVRNNGYALITNYALEIKLNGVAVDTFYWDGEMAFQDETEITFIIKELSEGENEISVTVLSVNADLDEIPDNNDIQWLIEADPDGQKALLYFKTDNFPLETSWKLFDAGNNVIAAGGPFTLQQNTYVNEFCLDPEACYTFTVYDSFGDGMSAQGVQGDFEIYDDMGTLLAELAKPNFGSQSSSEFCMTAECLFSAVVGVAHETMAGAGDAVAMAETVNGLGAITYSIDDGVNWQTSGTFPNLLPGIYYLLALDGAGCRDTQFFEILSCNLEVFITTKPAIGGDVGEIHITATGGYGPFTYSLNGGEFISDSFFLMLEPGEYMVTIRDTVGCFHTDTITISTMVSTSVVSSNNFIKISPNPGKGVYQVLARFEQEDIFIPYSLFTPEGIFLSSGTLALYDAMHQGEISLIAYPPGMYIVTFHLRDQMHIRRLIKLD